MHSSLSTSDYPSVSVIIPSYNQGQFIEETLLSVIGQQYPHLEIIVIDGGSTDNTIEILEKYADHLAYWHSKPDKGQADAINQGIMLSSGEVLCWLNSDDMFMPGTLLDVGKRFQGRTEQNTLIYGAALTIKENGTTISSDAQLSAPFDASRLTYSDYLVQPSTFWTRTLYQRTGELNIEYHYVLDWEWFIRASQIAKFEYVPKFYSVYRYHPLHKTSNGGDRRKQEIMQVVEQYSSDRWKLIYHTIDRKSQQIETVLKILFNLKIRGKSLLLLLLFPQLFLIVRTRRNLIVAIDTLIGNSYVSV